MRITQVLRVFFPVKKRITGKVDAGKYQRNKPVKTSMKVDAVDKMMRSEQNMKYITNPYLMAAEEEAYGADHKAVLRVNRKRAFSERVRKLFFPDRTIEEHFRDTVYQQKKWE